MNIGRRRLLALSSSISLLPRAVEAQSTAWPDRPIRLIVPYAAGGGVDNIARLAAQHLGQRLRQPVVVDNRPGAQANIGSDFVAKAPADGYTILMGATYLAFNRAAMRNLPYDALRDLLPVARVGRAPVVLVVPSALPVHDVRGLVEFVAAHPDRANYGVVGTASPPHLLFLKRTGMHAEEVLYRGGSAALPDLIAQRLTFMMQTTSEVLPFIRSGELRALAVSGPQRLPQLSQVQTLTEAGIPGINWTSWWGMFVPAGTPASIVDRLSGELVASVGTEGFVTALERMAVVPAPLPSDEFTKFFRASVAEHDAVVREFHITLE